MKIKRPFSLAAAVVFCAAGLTTATAANSTNLLTRTTFETEVYDPVSGEVILPASRPPWHPYTYPYAWGYAAPVPSSTRLLDTLYLDPPEMTNTVLQFFFDNSAYEPVPADGAYGLGFGGPHNWINQNTNAISTKRADYILSFDARAEGLLPGQTANVEAQTIFVVPDDTLLPADANLDPDPVLQLNISFQATNEWKHFELNLGQATFDSGTSQDLAAQYKHLISEIRFAFNLHLPHPSFGFDSDNGLYLDNLQLQVVGRAETSLPAAEQVIVDWNFDDRPSWYSYNYNWTGNTRFTSITNNHEAQGIGVGGSNAWSFQFDNSAFATVTPAYAGVGSGTGGPFNATYIDTTNLASYRVSFDARVEGLATNKSSTAGQLEFMFRVPDDTLLPPDAQMEDDVFFRVKYDVTLRTNWQSFAFTLDEGTYTDAEFANFTNYFGITSSLQPQLHVSSAASDFGADSNNVVVIDNLKFVRLTQGIPPLSIGRSGEQVIVTWSAPPTGTLKLQSSTSVNGPYTDISGAASPYSVSASNGVSRFFRTSWTP